MRNVARQLAVKNKFVLYILFLFQLTFISINILFQVIFFYSFSLVNYNNPGLLT